MKKVIFCLLSLFILVGCGTATKTKKSNSRTEASSVGEALALLEEHAVDFETVEAKIKCNYKDDRRKLNLKATVRIQKDEKIWISAGMFGFEGARMLVTPTRVQAINRLEKTYYDEPVEKLQELAGLPIDFHALQNLLLGKIIVLNEQETSFTATPATIELQTVLDNLVNKVVLMKPTYVIEQQTLTDQLHEQTMAVSYLNYRPVVDNQLFPYQTIITVKGEKPIEATINVQQIELDTNPSFDFSINKKYKRETID